MNKKDYVVKNYSEAFKLKILSDLSSGKYSKSELAALYGLSVSLINKWIKKFNRQDLMNKRVTVQTPEEVEQLKALKQELAQLKELLVQKDLELLVNRSYLEAVAQAHGYKSIEDLKKKLKIQP